MPDQTLDSNGMDLVATIGSSVIGKDVAVETPFGLMRLTYADYTASGRSLSFIEDYITSQVLPMYANTHTETSGTGLQTTRFREDARSIIRECVGGNSDEHAIIFAGSGATGAVDRLVAILGLRLPSQINEKYGLDDHIPPDERPVVFVGPFEHHSNELPWRETIAEVVEIPEDADGHIDLESLEATLKKYRGRPLKIGSFSAASNVTGIISDTSAISELLHRYDALSFWDFAASAPYVGIEMRSKKDGPDYKDAIFISPHKLIGGPGTPGVLVARKDLMVNPVPAVPGGGTVQFVTPDRHTYVTDAEHREEGGTPSIIGAIRAGLVFKLKEEVGPDCIRALEHDFISRAINSWSQNPHIRILGNPKADRLSIVSFVIDHDDRVLHYNYVVALLNDLFGIQSRGGCSCAGPYGHRLLGIDADTSDRFEKVIASGCEVIRPGWVRLNFNYFIPEEEFQYLVEAVHLIANEGWKLLPLYEFEMATAIWRHRDGMPRPPESLRSVSFGVTPPAPSTLPITVLPDQLDQARKLLAEPIHHDFHELDLPEEIEELRWFVKAAEVTN